MEDENFLKFAKDAGKVIIWVAKEEDLDSLSNCPIQTVNDFGNQYLLANQPSLFLYLY